MVVVEVGREIEGERYSVKTSSRGQGPREGGGYGCEGKQRSRRSKMAGEIY
jgi:hypothetical protein